jgi:regulator of replication initiation timing
LTSGLRETAMEQVTIWYLTDNDGSAKLTNAITGLGLPLNFISGYSLDRANIIEDDINIFIFDLLEIELSALIEQLAKDERIRSSLKFVIIKKNQTKEIANLNYNLMHLEFLSRPVDRREFMLLLEKTIIVERYREMMRFISRESEMRIEAYEGLMDINRKNVFESDKEKAAFENILNYEKRLMKEQTNLSSAIRDFTLLRQLDMYNMRDRIKAEEMLSDLRRAELMDAHKVIHAQESVIDYGARELHDAQKIINARERVEELSRSEIIELHKEISRLKNLNHQMSQEIERLKSENSELREKLGGR